MKAGAVSLALVLFIVLTMGLPPALAQSRPIEQLIVNQSSIVEQFAPPESRGSVRLSLSDARRQIPPRRAAHVTFVLHEVTLEGATILSPAVLAGIWKDRIGQRVGLPDLYELADAIEDAYEKAGFYAAAVVPLQDFESGRITIRVFDRSYIRTVEISSDLPHVEQRLAPYIDRIVDMRPLRVRELERILLLMTDLAGMDIEATLKRPERPGTGGYLTLEIRFVRSQLQISLDNHGSDETGPMELSGQLQVNDLMGLFETTTLTALTVPTSPEELVFGQFAQEIPVGSSGLHIGYSLARISSRPGGDLAGHGIEISSTVADVFMSYPFLRTIDMNVLGRLSFNTNDSSVDSSATPESRDRQRWLEAGVSIDRSAPKGGLHIEAAFLHGLDVLDASGPLSPLTTRPDAPTGFRILKGAADLSYGLTEKIHLHLRSEGQFAVDPLPAAVQISLGGDPFGRAFDPAVVAGDSGLAVSMEVGRAIDADLAVIQNPSLFGFVDYGAIWNRGDYPPIKNASLGSAGVGFRSGFFGKMNTEFGIAVPYDESGLDSDDRARLFFQFARSF